MGRIIIEAYCIPQLIAFFLDQDATDIDLLLVRARFYLMLLLREDSRISAGSSDAACC